MYNSYVGRGLNESDDKGRDKIKFFQELIDNALRQFKIKKYRLCFDFAKNMPPNGIKIHIDMDK